MPEEQKDHAELDEDLELDAEGAEDVKGGFAAPHTSDTRTVLTNIMQNSSDTSSDITQNMK